MGRVNNCLENIEPTTFKVYNLITIQPWVKEKAGEKAREPGTAAAYVFWSWHFSFHPLQCYLRPDAVVTYS